MPTNLLYGLHTLEDVRGETLRTVGVQEVRDAFDLWYTTYQQRINTFIDALYIRNESFNTTPNQRWKLPIPADFQPVDELGKADPIKMAQYQEIGLPIQIGELAKASTWTAALAMTVNDLNDWLRTVIVADGRFLKTIAMRQLFYNAAWTFTNRDMPNMPATSTVMPLANGDAQEYLLKTGNFTTADHYTAQSAQVSSSADPFPTIQATMSRYATVSASRPNLVSFVNGAALISGIASLPDFYPVANSRFVQWGVSENVVSDAIESQLYFGDRVLGEHSSGVVIVQWSSLPDNNIVTLNMDEKPLGLREHPEQALRGLVFKDGILSHYGNEDHSRVRRYAGTGVVNRTSGHVHQTATGGTTYVIPTGLTPLI